MIITRLATDFAGRTAIPVTREAILVLLNAADASFTTTRVLSQMKVPQLASVFQPVLKAEFELSKDKHFEGTLWQNAEAVTDTYQKFEREIKERLLWLEGGLEEKLLQAALLALDEAFCQHLLAASARGASELGATFAHVSAFFGIVDITSLTGRVREATGSSPAENRDRLSEC